MSKGSTNDLKVGVISCSGEELPEGTVSRLATRMVLEQLRPGKAVTLCLPLFLSAGENERAFARVHPTIAVDGCDKRCAARATEAYSARPAAVVVVSEVARRFPGLRPESRRELGEGGRELARRVAQEVAGRIDELLVRPAGATMLRLGPMAPADPNPIAPINPGAGTGSGSLCSCQALGPKVRTIQVSGGPVGIIALDEVLEQALAANLPQDELRTEILRAVKARNYVAPGLEEAYAEALWREFVAYRAKRGAGA